MTVRVRAFDVFSVQGAGRTTRFSDSFVRAATSLGAGDQYVSGPQPGVIESVGDTIFTNGTGFAIRASSVNANVRTSHVFYPIPILPFVKASQFAQMTLVSDNSLTGTANIAGGLFVLSGWQAGNDGYRDYGLSWTGADGSASQNSLRLRRMTGPSAEVVIASSASGSALAGDVVRIEVTVAPTQNTIAVFVNGVAVAALATVDNSATRPLAGNPGIGRMLWVSGAAPGVRTWVATDFSCGQL